jgi:phosphopantothenoylcysteine decarboxylase/phosphopantothenate--cysteine ligase
MNVLIGITGGIAAYKTYGLIRLFIKNGDMARVVLTQNALHFVQPLVIETLSGQKCYTDMFAPRTEIEHISLTQWADILVIAPATAGIIGKIAGGIADDLLSTCVLAMDNKPCYIFPAMNSAMYRNKILRQNLKKLKEAGFLLFDPVEGDLACSDKGKGRMPGPGAIFRIIKSCQLVPGFSFKSRLMGRRVLMTAGTTKAHIDPVRFISNRASGRMGVELARAFYSEGADVTCIGDRGLRERFPEIEVYSELVEVDTTEELLAEAEKRFDSVDFYLSSAAISDIANKPEAFKIKKEKERFLLKLQVAPDVFSNLSKKRKKQVMVGFALESENLVQNASDKLKKKNMDLIVANPPDSMGGEKTTAVIINKNGVKKEFIDINKAVLAQRIVEMIIEEVKNEAG